MNSYQEVATALKEHHKIAIVCHVNPDGDCIGSMLGLGLILRAMGKEVTLISEDTVPGVYDYLPGIQGVVGADSLGGQEMAVFVDCSDIERAGEKVAGRITGIPLVINLDHHVSNRQYGHFNLVDAGAAATGEIIYHLLKELAIPLTRDVAICLYTALVMDTGSFRYDNTTGQTHRIAAELIEAGINVFDINKYLFEEVPLATLRVIQLGLAGLQVSPCGQLAWMKLTDRDMLRIEAKDEHIDGLINYTRMIKGVEIGILFREQGEGLVKVSFRSKGRVDVNLLAGEFGGGGHPRASGCRLKVPLAQAEKQVIDAASRYLKES